MWGRAAEAEALALEIQGTEFLASCGAMCVNWDKSSYHLSFLCEAL